MGGGVAVGGDGGMGRRGSWKGICGGGGISTGDKQPTVARGSYDGGLGCGRLPRGRKGEMWKVFC
jgi:hypothetical protein